MQNTMQLIKYKRIQFNVSNTKRYSSMYQIQKNTVQCIKYKRIQFNVSNTKGYSSMYQIQKDTVQCIKYKTIQFNASNTKEYSSMYQILKDTMQGIKYKTIQKHDRPRDTMHVQRHTLGRYSVRWHAVPTTEANAAIWKRRSECFTLEH